MQQEMASPTRTCLVCHGEKPVSGVWYLLKGSRGPQAPSFVCEACYRVQAEPLA
jgi:hypothetical protein